MCVCGYVVMMNFSSKCQVLTFEFHCQDRSFYGDLFGFGVAPFCAVCTLGAMVWN
jgi:hypothetical protein